MPVHGEVRHLIANGKLAEKTGVPKDRVIVAGDGDVIDLKKGVARKVGTIDASYILVDGSTVGDISDSIMDRRILGEEGFVSVITVVDLHNRSIVSGPEIQARGLAEDDSVFKEAKQRVSDALKDAMRDGVDDPHRLQQVTRRAVGQWVAKSLRRRPMIVPVVVTT